MAAPTREQTFHYERTTPNGFLMRVYRNMQSRVVGIQKREAKFYHGLPLLPKPVFMAWTWAQEDFWTLWHAWQASGRVRRLVPSIDRINVHKGYTLDNMQWVPGHENSRRLMRRCRAYPSTRNGKHPNAKLTVEAVRTIRATYVARGHTGQRKGVVRPGTYQAFATQYGVSISTIRHAHAGRAWRYTEE